MRLDRERLLQIGAGFFGLLALPPGYFALTLRWEKHADFDVTGFLWLMQNIPRLTALVLTILFVGLALLCLLRSITNFE